MSSKQPAFTLIETLIAAAITVVVLGASVLTARTLSRNAQFTEENVQMTSLADEALADLALLQNSLPDSANLLDTLNGTSGNQTAIGIFVSNPISDPSCSGLCPSAENNGPIAVQWCSSTAVNTCRTGTPSPITPVNSGCSSSVCMLEDIFNYTTALDGQERGELVALRHRPYTAPGTIRQANAMSVGFLNPSSYGALRTDSTEWNFYIRRIIVARQNPDFAQTDGTNLAALKQGMYTATVKIRSLTNPEISLNKTVVITDHSYP